MPRILPSLLIRQTKNKNDDKDFVLQEKAKGDSMWREGLLTIRPFPAFVIYMVGSMLCSFGLGNFFKILGKEWLGWVISILVSALMVGAGYMFLKTNTANSAIFGAVGGTLIAVVMHLTMHYPSSDEDNKQS